MSRVAKFIETKNRKVVGRRVGDGANGSYLIGIEFQICKITKSSRDLLLNNVNVLNTTQLNT